MEFTPAKTIGIILLCIGLIIIAAAVYQSYNIFSGKTAAPPISKITVLEVASSSIDTLEIRLGPTKVTVSKEINAVIDTCLWTMFTMILVAAGGTVAGIGAQMLRDVRVKSK